MTVPSNKTATRTLYIVAAVLAVVAASALWRMYAAQTVSDRQKLVIEFAKGLIQIISIGVIGAVIKFLFDDYLDQRRASEETHAEARRGEEAFREFRADKVRRLVLVTNALRRAPIFIDAHRSARTYNEQMRALIDAGLELRLIRHEVEAFGAAVAGVFSAWPEIRPLLLDMAEYLTWLQADFRAHYKTISELQRAAEEDRKRQPEVWDAIRHLESIRDLLAVDTSPMDTKYYKEYLLNYEEALRLMIPASLHGAVTPTEKLDRAAPDDGVA